MFSLNDKKALVTGATGGIGGAIAQTFYEAGASLAISGSKQEKLEKLALELSSSPRRDDVFSIPCDLSQLDTVDQLIKEAEERLNGLDILVCNAGITRDTLAMRMSDEPWQSGIDMN